MNLIDDFDATLKLNFSILNPLSLQQTHHKADRLFFSLKQFLSLPHPLSLSLSLKKLLYSLSQKRFSGARVGLDDGGWQKTREKLRKKKKKERKKKTQLCFCFHNLALTLITLTKFNLSSLFGPISASSCGSGWLDVKEEGDPSEESGGKKIQRSSLRFG